MPERSAQSDDSADSGTGAASGTGTDDGWADRRFTDRLAGAARVQAAERLLTASRRDPALDRLAALASGLLAAPRAQVSLLTDVQTVAGGFGLPSGAVGSVGPLSASLCTVTAASGRPLVVDDATTDGRVSGLPPVLSGAVGSYLGVPLVVRGAAVGSLCVYDDGPRSWVAADVALLEHLAGSAVAEMELRALGAETEASRLMWELAIDAAGIGIFDWDLVTGQLIWDDRLLGLFGYARGEFDESIDGFYARVHPDDLPRVSRALEEAIRVMGVYESEYRVMLPGGRTRWVGARGRALPDTAGTSVRVVGAAWDISARREAEYRVARVLESMSAAFYSLDRDWRFSYVNAEAERLLGRSRHELLGGVIWELFPGAVGSAFEIGYRRAFETGEQVTFDAYYPAPLDGWYELRVWPGEDGLSVYFLDVSVRREAQRQAEAAAAQAAMLAAVTSGLTETLDPDVQAERLVRMVVPMLADSAVVTLLDDDPRTRDHGGVRAVAVWPPGVPPVASDHGLRLPLRAPHRTLGWLELGPETTPVAGGRRLRAQEVAERAGLALDNARLHRQRLRLVEELQRSMLTEPPQPDHMQIAVRYQPAAQDVQIGGDWYDAFLQPDGATVLVIGDVVGHDSAAAAAMGQVRTLLRAVATDRGEAPAQVLTRVDRVMETLQLDSAATAVVARLEQDDDERRLGVTRLRWSNAGHPPPVLHHPDGRAEVIGADEPDLLLGIDPTTGRADHVMVVERGSTLLLYTDGLVERRDQSLEDGIEQLRNLVQTLAGGTLDELCDGLLRGLVPERSEDDVALVGVRLHPQDGPRPAEAGPQDVPESVLDDGPDDGPPLGSPAPKV